MECKRLESIYVILEETTYVEKRKSNETSDLWHARVGHVSYNKLNIMMQQSKLKVLLNLILEETLYVLDVNMGNHINFPMDNESIKRISH